MKTQKIGEVNFGRFKTDFRITSKVKKYFGEEHVSLSTLLPNAWEWYEVYLFELIDENRTRVKKFGKSFLTIYYGIKEILGRKEKRIFKEEPKNKKVILFSEIKLKSVKNLNKEFMVDYMIIPR